MRGQWHDATVTDQGALDSESAQASCGHRTCSLIACRHGPLRGDLRVFRRRQVNAAGGIGWARLRGRRRTRATIVQEELQGHGAALPWVDEAAFARRAIAMALADHVTARRLDGWVFFDRGLIDAAAALEHATGEPALSHLGQLHRYHRCVFLVPPWPEVYRADAERRHDVEAAIAEYERLQNAYPLSGYEVIILPKVGVVERADFVLHTLAT